MGKVINLLSLEWMKFKNNSVFILFGTMFVLTFPLAIFIGKEIKNLPKPLPDNSIFYIFPTVWEWLAYEGSWLAFFFLAFIVMNMITTEVSNKTMRQNIITGLTRRDFFIAKLASVLSLCIAATLFYIIVALLIGYFHNDPYSLQGAFADTSWILRYFLMCLGYLSFALMIGFLVRSPGVSIFVYISYIFFIEPLLKWSVDYKLTKDSTINYWPMNAIEDLTPLPLYKYAENIPRQDLDFNFLLDPYHAMIAVPIYSILFIGIAYWHFMSRDI